MKKHLDLSDKRHIHILLTLLCQDDQIEVKTYLRKNLSILSCDNYGKYLLSFYKEFQTSDYERSRIQTRIEDEHNLAKNVLRKGSFLFGPVNDYLEVIAYLSGEPYENNLPTVQSIKRLVHEQLHERWSEAFNQLQNLFHELCKQEFQVKDNEELPKLIQKIPDLTPSEELLVIKFYNRRNFSPISHPSMGGVASEEISATEFKEYKYKILRLIVTKIIIRKI